MRTLVTLEFLVFFALAFGLRSYLQWRATGTTGFVGVRRGASVLERLTGAALGLALVLGPVAPWLGEPLWQRGHGLGAVLAFVGIGLVLVAQLQMGRSWRIGVNDSERTELITTGVFALVRNPIFSAMLLVSLGLALAAPTALALALPPVLWLALELQVRRVEEPYLLRTHGAPYLDWACRTGRFLPGVGRLPRPTP